MQNYPLHRTHISQCQAALRDGDSSLSRKPFVQLMRPETHCVQWTTDFIRACQRWWLNNCVLFGAASYVHTSTILQLHCTQYRCTVHNIGVQYTIPVYCTQYRCTVHNTGVLYTIPVYCTQYRCTVHNIGVGVMVWLQICACKQYCACVFQVSQDMAKIYMQVSQQSTCRWVNNLHAGESTVYMQVSLNFTLEDTNNGGRATYSVL